MRLTKSKREYRARWEQHLQLSSTLTIIWPLLFFFIIVQSTLQRFPLVQSPSPLES